MVPPHIQVMMTSDLIAFKPQNGGLSVFQPSSTMSKPEDHMPKAYADMLRKQHYDLFGHSSAKTCHYTKAGMTDQKMCYKFHFYGIASHRCIQMTPVTMNCSQSCTYCWRPTNWQGSGYLKNVDEPEAIVAESIRAQKRLLSGVGSLVKQGRVSQTMWEQSLTPKHVAISLTGEPTLYPRLAELLQDYHKRHISTFLVSNGLQPEALQKLKETELPTQLYVSIDSPNKDVHIGLNKPAIADSWERLMQTLDLFPSLDCRKVLRVTVVKGWNMDSEEQFAELVKRAKPDFVELKGYSWIGLSRARLTAENSPEHAEIKSFAERILQHLPDYQFGGEFEDSRVVMLWNGTTPKLIPFEKFFQERGY